MQYYGKIKPIKPPNRCHMESFAQNGKLHSAAGPALIFRDVSGLKIEMYFKHGQLHRDDGPAISVSNATGSAIESYFTEGVQGAKRLNPRMTPPSA